MLNTSDKPAFNEAPLGVGKTKQRSLGGKCPKVTMTFKTPAGRWAAFWSHQAQRPVNFPAQDFRARHGERRSGRMIDLLTLNQRGRSRYAD